ncbi:MAG: hypothetical protein ACJ8FY_09760 [Gemmataceae bacterium]
MATATKTMSNSTSARFTEAVSDIVEKRTKLVARWNALKQRREEKIEAATRALEEAKADIEKTAEHKLDSEQDYLRFLFAQARVKGAEQALDLLPAEPQPHEEVYKVKAQLFHMLPAGVLEEAARIGEMLARERRSENREQNWGDPDKNRLSDLRGANVARAQAELQDDNWRFLADPMPKLEAIQDGYDLKKRSIK